MSLEIRTQVSKKQAVDWGVPTLAYIETRFHTSSLASNCGIAIWSSPSTHFYTRMRDNLSIHPSKVDNLCRNPTIVDLVAKDLSSKIVRTTWFNDRAFDQYHVNNEGDLDNPCLLRSIPVRYLIPRLRGKTIIQLPIIQNMNYTTYRPLFQWVVLPNNTKIYDDTVQVFRKGRKHPTDYGSLPLPVPDYSTPRKVTKTLDLTTFSK